ncbi:MAG: DUF362 domain-containing protein [Deltaproteobacteria bacterium]|nr:DUF362 domain-containing protein [Deltaproteobacteria bacterium]
MFDVIRCQSFKDVKEAMFEVLEKYKVLLPSSNDAKILLKPNLNANMNALTGNTTDLRILSVVIQYLKGKEYTNIVIGEGTNSGYYRNKIGVISRLKVDQLARYYGVKVKDLNYAEPYEIDFDGGVKAQVARDCMEADLFINLPKLKTHFEVGMSVCLKNLMGCLIGQKNKKKTHLNLAENILRINQSVKPHLHIVDAMVAMEGLGPTRGTPVRMDTIISGTDPYLIDLVCAKIAGFHYKDIKTLSLAEKKELLTAEHHRFVESLDLEKIITSFAPPKPGPMAAFIHSPKRQKYFLNIRNTKLFAYLASTDWFGKLLFMTGLRQDVFLQDEMSCNSLYLEEKECTQCNICQDLCPLGLDLPGYLKNMDEKCIYCLYCFSACPEKAIKFDGDFGFFREQLKQYDSMVRMLYH